MIGFHPVVRVLPDDVQSAGQHVLDYARVGGCPIRGHLRRRGDAGQRPGEEPPKNRTYQRTASVITSGRKRNPANSERAAAACRVDLTLQDA